jgi:hypothetical protein
MSLSRSARRLSLGAGFGGFFMLLAACSSDANTPITPPGGGTGGVAATAGSATGGGGATATAGAPAGGAATAGAAAGGASSAGTSGASVGGAGVGGSGGTGGQSGGSGGASGSASAGGGSAGGGSCTPGTAPATGTMYTRTDWAAQWNFPCNFTTYGGCPGVTPTNAFDGNNDTRTSLGDTHLKPGGTAEQIGDAFTFDMKSCNQIGKIVMWTDGPPDNTGKNDDRDYPGAADVTVSSDCTTTAGLISGTFGSVVASANEPQPGCNGGSCKMPMTFTITPPVAAKCVKITLTKILKVGGPVWWGIGELDVFPP